MIDFFSKYATKALVDKQISNAINGAAKNAYTITPATLGKIAAAAHETGIFSTRRSKMPNVTTLIIYVPNVAHAQPASPYRGIKTTLPTIFTIAANTAANIEIYVVDVAFDNAA